MFPVNGSLRTAPLFPRSGPGESGSPMSQVLLRRYDFPPRISGHLFASLPGSARSSSVRVSQLALPEGRRAFWARVVVQPATQSAGLLARGRGRDLPGSQAIHPVPLPRSATPAEPTIPRLVTGFVDAAPPVLPTAKASAVDEFRGSITRLWHLLPTLHEWCCHHPGKARFRLAGSPLPGGSRTLWIATKGFRSQSHPSFLDLSWRKGSFILNLPLRSHHSITSSAMASSPGGKLRPNALAVLRLITNSNLIDCMTGRSPGFSPLRMRPVYIPARRFASTMLVP